MAAQIAGGTPKAGSGGGPELSANPNVRRFRETFENLQKKAVQEVDTSRIRPSLLNDRFDVEDGLDELTWSIQEAGQQLPVLLRSLPEGADADYEPVYGRRRIAACARLGIPVRAIIADMDDEEAILAQGLENAARLDTSFIERAVFVVSALQAGHKPQVVEKALGVDQSLISRMRNVVDDIPDPLIRAIGPAHGMGRRPWEQLRALLTSRRPPALSSLLELADPSLPSPARLKAVLAAAEESKPGGGEANGEREIVPDGLRARRAKRSLTLKIKDDASLAFLDHLEERLPELFEAWRDTKEGP
jgi:ParB family chromosome partitioning protein